MGDELLYLLPLFSFVYGPAFTYLCIISHQCNAFKSNFKENMNILIPRKASDLGNSLLLRFATSVNVWDNMASLDHQPRSDFSEIYE